AMANRPSRSRPTRRRRRPKNRKSESAFGRCNRARRKSSRGGCARSSLKAKRLEKVSGEWGVGIDYLSFPTPHSPLPLVSRRRFGLAFVRVEPVEDVFERRDDYVAVIAAGDFDVFDLDAKVFAGLDHFS